MRRIVLGGLAVAGVLLNLAGAVAQDQALPDGKTVENGKYFDAEGKVHARGQDLEERRQGARGRV